MIDLFFRLPAKDKPHHVHVHIRTFPLSDIPKDKAGLESWMSTVFEEKDKLLDYYHKHGCFPGEVLAKTETQEKEIRSRVVYCANHRAWHS
jgi:hypothetical protein